MQCFDGDSCKKHTLAQCFIHVSLSITDGAKEAEHNRESVTNSNVIGESNDEFQQLEDKRPEQPIQEEEEEEEADDISPEHEEVNLSDIREAEEQYDSGRGSLLGNTASGSVNSGQSVSEDTAGGNLLELGCIVPERGARLNAKACP